MEQFKEGDYQRWRLLDDLEEERDNERQEEEKDSEPWAPIFEYKDFKKDLPNLKVNDYRLD